MPLPHRCSPRCAVVALGFVLACPNPGGGTATDPSSSSSTSDATGTATAITGGGAVCPGDSFEPNSVFEDATPLSDGEFESVICPFDTDFYALTVTGTTYLSVILYLARVDGELGLDLLGPEMQLIRWSSGRASVPTYPLVGIEAVHAELSRPGTYFLRVSHFSGDVIPYSFVVQQFRDETP